ncbi:head GIN domain-containing protein [Chryseobacterium sp. T1]
MKKIITALALGAAIQFSWAQTKTVGAFTSLKVFDKIPVQLVQSNDYKVEISGSNARDVEFVNSGSELKVRMVTSKILQGDDTKIILYYKNINNIQASQGARISSNGVVKAIKLNLVSNEGSNVDLDIDASSLEVKINTGGMMTLSGSTDTQNVIVNTGAKYNAKSLESEIASVTTNAGGEAEVFASKSVTAKTRAGGVIDIYGNPNERNDKKLIGGKINYH